MTWFSDVRVAVLLWFAAGALAAVSVSSLQRFLTLATLGFVLVVGLIAFAPRDSKIYDKSRFAKVDFLSIAENDFVKYRMGECKEVIKYFRQTVNIPRLALGHGFGAAYPSNGSHLAHLKSKVFRRNALANKVNEHGLTHTLHFGPVRVFFRYGLVGVGLYLLLAYFILSDVARLLLGRTQHGDDPDVAFVNTILLITIFCMLVRFHLKNVEHDLDFAFVLAAYLSRRQWFNTLGEDFDDEEEYEEDDYHDDYEHADDYSPEYA